MQIDQPVVQDISERLVAYVSYKGNYVGKPEIFADLFGKLCGWAGPRGLLTPDSVLLASYDDDFDSTPPDELTLNICMSISEEVEIEGEIEKKTLPGGQYAVMHAELTDPMEYCQAWKAIVDWAKANDFTHDLSRPCYEIYLNDPAQHPEKHHILNVCLSVKPV